MPIVSHWEIPIAIINGQICKAPEKALFSPHISKISNFRLWDIPFANVKSVLSKMNFREASRMRRTCHQIDDIVDNFSFPIEMVFDTLGFHIGDCRYGTRSMILDKPELKKTFLFDAAPMFLMADWKPINLTEGGLFDVISVGVTATNPSDVLLIEFFRREKIKCRKLALFTGYVDGIDAVKLFKASSASKLSLEKAFRNDEPFPFEIIRKLSVAKCRELKLEVSSLMDSDYVEIFSRFEAVEINSVSQGSSPPIAPLRMRMITDPNILLRKFKLPIYNLTDFLSESEMAELSSKTLCLDMCYTNAFVLVSPTDYIMIFSRYRGNNRWCTCRRISKDNIEAIAIEWFDLYVTDRIPYDLSGLYDCIALNDYLIIEKYMEFLMDNAFAYRNE